MYSTEFSKGKYKNKLKYEILCSRKIEAVAPILWSEHCLECAAPLCYGKCPKYKRRIDGRCKLFNNGITPIEDRNSIYGQSVSIEFGEWSKLEADVSFTPLSLKKVKKLNKNLQLFSKSLYCTSYIFEGRKKLWWLTNKGYNFKEKTIKKYSNDNYPDAFFLSAISNNKKKLNLFFEIKKSDNTVIYRNSIIINEGYNEKIISFNELNIKAEDNYKVYLYTNKKCEIIFTMLDFVYFEKKKKIKCVAWDLDNTLWNGVFIEDKVKFKDGIIDIIKELDSRGIVNSIVSKNNEEEILKFLKKNNIDEFFVMPQINWNPKSININNLVKQMNIGIDTIAFIDDSPFEREEVLTKNPNVNIYKDCEYKNLLSYPEFQVIITEDTKNRRKTYKMLEQQNKEFENFSGDIDDFLKQCKMKATFRTPKKSEYNRCYELIQRTNQLNSSGRRLTLEELEEYFKNDNFETYLIQVEDKFGNYGIVGFSIVDISNDPTITDFVISCRVANKKVEHTYILYLAKKYKEKGFKSLKMNYTKTSKNGPIFKVVSDLNMKEYSSNNNSTIYYLDLKDKLETIDIMQVNEK